MSVKKTGSKNLGGAEPLKPTGRKDLERAEKAEGNFKSAMAELGGHIEQMGHVSDSGSVERSTLGNIASNAHLESADGAFGAVKESAGFLVQSRLNKDILETEEGKKLTEDISDFIARDPYLHNKILGVLQRLKAE